MTTIFGHIYARNQISELSVDNGLLHQPTGIAFDSDGNMCIGNYNDSTLSVLCPVDTTLYGIDCSANVITSLNSLDIQSFLTFPRSLAFDAAGNLIILDWNNGIAILPKNDITFFDVVCPLNQITPIGILYEGTVDFSSLTSMKGLAIDTYGTIFIGSEDNLPVFVLSPAATTLYGISIPEKTITALSSLDIDNVVQNATGLAFDSVGNLYIGNWENEVLSVLPPADTTLFGKDFSGNRITDTGLSNENLYYPDALAFDKDGNLFIGSDSDTAIYILPKADVTLYGVFFPANVISSLSGLDILGIIDTPYGLAFDQTGNLFICSSSVNYISVLPASILPTFPTSIMGTTYATESTNLLYPKTITDFLAKPQRRRNYPQGTTPPIGTPLRDTGRRKYAFGRNNLKTYIFHEVTRMDTLESGYLCTWAASGISPITL